MADLYECHVTVNKPTTASDRKLLDDVAVYLHWKTSEIDGDPVLGRKLHYYFTSHGDDFEVLRQRMLRLSQHLRDRDVKIVREKIEKIVYDVRY